MKRIFFVLIFFFFSLKSYAVFETSLGFSFSRSDYGNGNFSWKRRWNLGLGYHFSNYSGVEVGFMNEFQKIKPNSTQVIEQKDLVLSLNWIQSLVPSESLFMPFFKVGLGQLNRSYTGVIRNYKLPIIEENNLAFLIGLGLRIKVSQRFQIRSELTSYPPSSDLSKIKDNTAFTVGFSLFY